MLGDSPGDRARARAGVAVTPIPFAGRLVRGVKRPIKPYEPKDPNAPGLVIGFDTETIQDDAVQRAELYTIQLARGPHGRDATLHRASDAREAWAAIVAQLRAWGHRPEDGPIVMWAVNLNFDLLWLFGSSAANRRLLAGGAYFGKHRQLDADGAKIGLRSFVYGRVAFADIDHQGYRFLFRDVLMWWAGSADQLGARMGYRKAPRPTQLGRYRFLERQPSKGARFELTPEPELSTEARAFIRYAKRDAVIAWRAGDAARQTLTDLGIWSYKHVPVSAAHASAILFRSKLPAEIPPPRTFPELRAALFAFAGGRAGTRVRGSYPKRVNSYDVNSMYPAAMLDLPEPASWAVTTVREYQGPNGIYLVDGRCDDRRWPALVERDKYGRLWPLVGEFRGVWVTGWEIESFRRWGDGELTVRHGYHYASTRKPITFPRFVAALYPLRSHESAMVRDLAKTMLNGLSGKFIEIHSRFALPRGLRVRVPAPSDGGYYIASEGRHATDPNDPNATPVEVFDEYADSESAREFDTYIATIIEALMNDDYDEIVRRTARVAQGSQVIEVNLEYAQHDTGRTFAPELATLILGRARARLHDLMHEHQAIYWDTDSIVTTRSVPTGDQLGQLKREATGWLTVARPKLYAIRSKAGDVQKLAAAGFPDRLPQATKVAIVDGSVTEYQDARAVSPRTTRDPRMRDVGTFYPVTVRAEGYGDDPRQVWHDAGTHEEAEALPMPTSARGVGRLRYA